jgi:hypothetical protein
MALAITRAWQGRPPYVQSGPMPVYMRNRREYLNLAGTDLPPKNCSLALGREVYS